MVHQFRNRNKLKKFLISKYRAIKGLITLAGSCQSVCRVIASDNQLLIHRKFFYISAAKLRDIFRHFRSYITRKYHVLSFTSYK